MGLTATADSTFEWRDIGAQVTGNERQHKVALTRGGAAEQAGQIELAHHAQRSGHMAVRQGAQDLHQLARAADHGAASEEHAQAVDQSGRQLAEIGDRALMNAVFLAMALAQENRRSRLCIRDKIDGHFRSESRHERHRKTVV